ncbi:MAG: hypothetical protein IPG07_09570 [Crocinitomicaceae bacterium]|nr:hypothetical protein [Crocinitomicaceae bacterium]
MNHFHHDRSLGLEKRYLYSKNLAKYFNANYNVEDAKWQDLKIETEGYFRDEKKENVNENWVYAFSKSKSKNLALRFLYLLFLFPVFW